MKRFLGFPEWILQKWLAYKDRKIREAEAKIKKHEEVEKLKKRFQEKKEELDRIRSLRGE